jgi:hypothetical protein
MLREQAASAATIPLRCSNRFGERQKRAVSDKVNLKAIYSLEKVE